jgi:hypothetical protein
MAAQASGRQAMDTLQQMTADVKRFQGQQELAQRQRDDMVRERGGGVWGQASVARGDGHTRVRGAALPAMVT